MRNILYFITGCILLLQAVACESFLAVDPPVQDIMAVEVFSSKRTAESAIIGMYSRMTTSNNHALNGFMSLYMGLAADEFANTAVNATFDVYKNNAILGSTASVLGSAWAPLYNYMYHANAIIDGLQKSTGIALADRQALLGEAYFVRGLVNFYLANLFGPVPLVLDTDYEKNRVLAKSSLDDLYDQVESDLLQAETLLSTDYPDNTRIRPNVYAAKALLARVYLYRENYPAAVLRASEIIENSELYTLAYEFDEVFLSDSKEAIWQLFPVNVSYNSAEGLAFIPSSATARPPHALYGGLLQDFDEGDKRVANWTQQRTLAGITYTYPFKYKIRANTTKTEYNTVFRLAEQYLIRAEARLNMEQVDLAVSDINMLRRRANVLEYPEDMDAQQVMKAIIKERRTEFFAEWGHRWLDLKRWGIIDEEMLRTKPDWKGDNLLLPIPEAELLRNPSLTPN
ncbi:RagB/SusD family nutrient uptake outer membrane protein [Sphingobacterium pedocola]|uniref:RagB/SusD family nutrient uptake outer membrane protein n=1 Tax=Sphingobacterium pedocola TaxID=2082722 RepID=A0ABR9T898_9SPHI|nr:RagB/SusD family nutrient uptake outer membrane protein [Sphingobacterium pedocola]MBE8721566.1 RagB/SusD family nutrient uptake outer membrane protein [Sphingobacterium pedocola]